MLRTMKLTLAVAAVTALGAGAAAAQTVTYERVYTTTPGVTYTASVQTYVTRTPILVQRPEPEAVAVPDTLVTEPAMVVTERSYVVPQTVIIGEPAITEQYAAPATRVTVSPRNCGVYHFWNGTACVDARDR